MYNTQSPFRAALLITENCNASCAHCWFSAKKCGKTMTLENASNYIKKLRESPSISWLSISGGEPLLYPDLVESVIRDAYDLGFNVEIVTNCYWAENRNKSIELLKRLKIAGLTALNISSDDFHQTWVPFECVKNAYSSCKDLGINMIIMTTIMKGSHYNLDLISYLIGDKIPSVNEFHPGIHWAKGIESHFVPVGRGSKISSKNWIYPSSMLNGPCTNVLRDLGVDIDGNVMPCCSALARLKNLKLGNLKRRNLSEILEMAYKKQYFKTLSSLGPTQLAERGFANKYTSKCHLCYDVLKKF